MMPKILIAVTVVLMSFFIAAAAVPAEDRISYDNGMKKVVEYRKNKEFSRAEELLKKMLRQYGNNTELMELLAQTLYWQKKYDESIRLYRAILRMKQDPRIRSELGKVSLAREFSIIEDLKNQGFVKEAEKRLKKLYRSDNMGMRAGQKLVMFYINERKYDKALLIMEEMKERYPDNLEIETMYIETLVLSGEISMAGDRLSRLSAETRSEVQKTREDLFYRVRRNYMSLRYSRLHYTRGIDDEKRYDVNIRQRIRERTFVLGYSNVDRFGKNDNQAEIEIYSKLGEMTRRWGYIAGTVSPSPDFLARWTLSGAVYQGYGNFDFSIGYKYMSFKATDVNILKPGFIAYLPYQIAWSESLDYNLDEGTSTLISKIHYEPNHRFNAYYSYSFGKSAEEIGSALDTIKVKSYAHSAGAEYRFTDRFSIGAVYRFSHRDRLHDKEGAEVFAKYWW
jgi:YaiO family outer membrane protein